MLPRNRIVDSASKSCYFITAKFEFFSIKSGYYKEPGTSSRNVSGSAVQFKLYL